MLSTCAPRYAEALHKQRQANRKKQRVQYFKNNTSVRRGSPAVIAAMEEDLKQRLAPGGALGERVFDSREIGAAQYGMALASLCREQNLVSVKGEGTFSDVYAVDATPDGCGLQGVSFFNPPGWCAAEADDGAGAGKAICSAVLKCSVPFPGVIQGRPVGDGLGIGEVEARVLSLMPRHPNVVRLLAAFLSSPQRDVFFFYGVTQQEAFGGLSLGMGANNICRYQKTRIVRILTLNIRY